MSNIKRTIYHDNRRDYIRLKLTLPIKYMPINDHVIVRSEKIADEKFELGLLMDISGGGLKFLVSKDVSLGSLLKLEFNLPTFPDGIHILLGRVVHREPYNNENKFVLRVRFESIEENIRNAIIKYIFDRQQSTT